MICLDFREKEEFVIVAVAVSDRYHGDVGSELVQRGYIACVVANGDRFIFLWLTHSASVLKEVPLERTPKNAC